MGSASSAPSSKAEEEEEEEDGRRPLGVGWHVARWSSAASRFRFYFLKLQTEQLSGEGPSPWRGGGMPRSSLGVLVASGLQTSAVHSIRSAWHRRRPSR